MHAADHSSQYQSASLVSYNVTSRKDTVYRFWQKAAWLPAEADEVYALNSETGHVTVKEAGLYMIYAQIVYHDLTGRWSFGIYIDSTEKLKCLTSEQLRDVSSLHPTSHGVYKQCYTASVIYMHRYQSVHIRCMYGMRTILTQPEFTFWGLVKIA
jgi:predicted acyl esterase